MTKITDRNVARAIVANANATISRQQWCEEIVRMATKNAQDALRVPDFARAAQEIERAAALDAEARAHHLSYEALRALVEEELFRELMEGDAELVSAAA